MEQGKCYSCGAPILFVKAIGGNTLAIDPEPVDGGTIALANGVAHIAGQGSLFVESLPAGPRYKTHYSTCPNAAKHRKRK